MKIKVCLDDRDFIGKNRVESMFAPKTWYHPMVIAVILGGAVWPKSIFWIDYWRKSFLDQCTNLSQNRIFPRSRLGRMTYRKLKPYPSWYLLHAPFNWLYPFHQKIEKTTKNHIFPSGCCLINIFNSILSVASLHVCWVPHAALEASVNMPTRWSLRSFSKTRTWHMDMPIK